MATLTADDGVELHVESHGEGIPVVLSCGLNTTCENFRAQVDSLPAAGVQLILWDYRGHGRSGCPDDASAYTLDRVLDDLGRVLDWAAPGRRAVLGGVSFGGYASLHFAHRHPQRVRALILVATGPGFKNPQAAARWAEWNEKVVASIEANGLAAFVRGPAAPELIGLDPELPAARAAADAIARQDPTGLAHFSRQIVAQLAPIIDELAEIDCPALVVVGEKDDAYQRAADVLAARLPRVERQAISGAGHMPNIEAPDAFDSIVAKFVAGLGGERSD